MFSFKGNNKRPIKIAQEPTCSFFLVTRYAIPVARDPIPVARDAIHVARDGSNLPLSGTVVEPEMWDCNILVEP